MVSQVCSASGVFDLITHFLGIAELGHSPGPSSAGPQRILPLPEFNRNLQLTLSGLG